MTEIDGVHRDAARRALARLDTNLIVALDALLVERNVTRAAEKLNLSQPALSASLSRLRAHFGDPLLVRRGRQFDLSPLGSRLLVQSADAIASLHSVLDSNARFDPATAMKEFVIHGSDYSAITIGVRLQSEVAAIAPGVSLRFIHYDGHSMPSPTDLINSSDGAIFPHGHFFATSHLDLSHDRWVCLVSRENARVGESLTLADLGTLEWVVGPRRMIGPIRQLELLGVQPRVTTIVGGMMPVPHFIEGTDRIAFLPEALVRSLPNRDAFRVLDVPFDIAPHVMAFWWNPMLERDPAHQWLRGLLATVRVD